MGVGLCMFVFPEPLVVFSTDKGPLIQCPLSYFSFNVCVCVLFSPLPLSCVFPLFSLHFSVFFHLCPSTLKLLEFNSPASESVRPLSRLQGAVSPSLACWYRAHSLSFSDTCWSREVLQQSLLLRMKDIHQKLQ